MLENNKTNTKLLITSSITGFLLSFPITGFIYGFIICEDCGDGFSGILGRLFIGLVESILTTITFGAPWDNEGGTSSTNLRFFVFLTFTIITLLIYFIRKRKNKKSKADN
ncbi:hypothetical protein [Flavobacterium saliperosum]|uniref:Uncharacterized protein n=1 Tax=Flavobacterium saliperosum TaxID=329186 RepID=A0A1G4WB46_9FLAO|nr:hypothetical protein [Flavobacterium saliperosum]SCX19231.1 hypothetical protein SAMN02927925_02782 [Flavobacterium saliperosum]